MSVYVFILGGTREARRVDFLSFGILINQELLQGRQEGVITFPAVRVASRKPGSLPPV